MPPLTDAGRALVAEIAARHGLAQDTVSGMLAAVVAGGGTQAQFNLPELGGMGQWSAGGMTMVGDMFNSGLQARVASLCSDLAAAVQGDPTSTRVASSQSQSQGGSPHPMGESSFFQSTAPKWPAHLGTPSTQGAQNDLRYAVFPAASRLAIVRGGRMTLYDTGPHKIGGVSQAQSGGQMLSFSSQLGTVRPEDLLVVPAEGETAPEPQQSAASPLQSQVQAQTQQPPEAEPEPPSAGPDQTEQPTEPALTEAQTLPDPAPEAARPSGDDILSLIERLADLRDRGILDDAEFAAKKADLLGRL